jgi:uncharacterized cupin superfamily protein
VFNRSSAPCSFLVAGMRTKHDICHYSDTGKTLYTEGETWRLVARDGSLLKSGRT